MNPCLNVVVPNFGTSPSAQKFSQRKTPELHADHDLISKCVDYGAQIAAASVAYKIDPTDAEIASCFDLKAQRRAKKALAQVAALPAKTFDGLRAKSAAAKVMLDDWIGPLEPEQRQLVMSLINDVVQFQRNAADERRSDLVVPEPKP